MLDLVTLPLVGLGCVLFCRDVCWVDYICFDGSTLLFVESFGCFSFRFLFLGISNDSFVLYILPSVLQVVLSISKSRGVLRWFLLLLRWLLHYPTMGYFGVRI